MDHHRRRVVDMAIEKSTLTPGTRLAARYKHQTYLCTVEQGEGDRLAFVLEDGQRFTSPSAAGSAPMGGIAGNGLRFWSLEGELKPARAAADKAPSESRSARTAKNAEGS